MPKIVKVFALRIHQFQETNFLNFWSTFVGETPTQIPKKLDLRCAHVRVWNGTIVCDTLMDRMKISSAITPQLAKVSELHVYKWTINLWLFQAYQPINAIYVESDRANISNSSNRINRHNKLECWDPLLLKGTEPIYLLNIQFVSVALIVIFKHSLSAFLLTCSFFRSQSGAREKYNNYNNVPYNFVDNKNQTTTINAISDLMGAWFSTPSMHLRRGSIFQATKLAQSA